MNTPNIKTPKIWVNAEFQRLLWLNLSWGMIAGVAIIYALFLPARQIAHAAIQLVRQPQKLHRAAHRLRQIAIGYAARFCRIG